MAVSVSDFSWLSSSPDFPGAFGCDIASLDWVSGGLALPLSLATL
jgi:hypothetical protein